MISNFDFFGRYERPELILCNPDDSEIGIITNAEGLQTEICLSDISSISYRIYETDDPMYNSSVYDKHIERRQVRVVGVGYFIITSSSECEDENGKYKQIEAKSCEYELNNIALPYINGTYQLYKMNNFTVQDNETIAQQGDEYLNENCILYEIMKVIPSWTLDGQTELIGDGARHSAEMKEKYKQLGEAFRTFEYSDTTVYSFLTKELQDSYSCFVHFNIEERKIQILHQEDVFEVLPMVISKANILNSCEVSTTIDSYVNALNVEGTTGVSIASINPLGGSMIYNFDHDINTGLIEGELKTLLEYWNSSMKKQATYNGVYYPSDVVQRWLDAPSKISDYKFKLLDEIGKGENGNVSQLIETPSFLQEVGLSNEEMEQFKTEITEAVEKALADADGDSEINTGNIENIFFKIGRYRINLLTTSDMTESMDVQGLNKFLYSAQELEIGIQSEIDSLESYKKGYDAQYKALDVTATDGSESAQNARTAQLEVVKGYCEIIEASKEQYTSLLKGVKSVKDSVNLILTELYKENGFESRFTQYYKTKGYGDEDAKNKAFEVYKNLTRYIKQQTYTDDTIVITDAMGIEEKFTQESELFNSSTRLLEKISIPEYEINIAAESFLFSEEYRNIASKLNTRSSIYVEVPNGDVPLFHLLKISIAYDEPSCELTLGNRIRLSDPTAVFSDLQRTASSAANIVAAERVEWGIREEKINELMTQKNADIDTTFRMMSNSVNKTTMGNDGFKCYSVDADGNQNYGIWCANGVMMFMDTDEDTGETKPQMAIGRMIKSDGSKTHTTYGFYGQSIIANTITADKLIAGALSKGTNYIRNGSFEASTNYWFIPPDAAFVDNGILTPVGHKFLVVYPGKYLYQRLSTQETPVAIPKGTYTLSFYYRRFSGANETSGIERLRMVLIEQGTEVGVCEFSDNQTTITTRDGYSVCPWARCYKTFEVSSDMQNPSIRIINDSQHSVCIDGVMLEKAVDINDYTPHISESYARYTTIDDSGVTVYDGKIRILNTEGTEVLEADEGGNLTIIGKLTANAGSNIAGWITDENKIFKGGTGMMSGGNYAFYAGADDNGNNPKFSVNHEGYLTSNDGKIGGWNIDANKFYNGNTGVSTNGDYVFYAGEASGNYNFSVTQKGFLFAKDAEIADKLTLKNGQYNMIFDGYSILMRHGAEDTNNKYSSAISFTSTGDGLFGTSTNNANLAIAGSSKILFGTRPDGNWKGLCEIEHSVSGSVLNAFHFKPSNGLTTYAYLGSTTSRWNDLYLDGLTSISGLATGSVKSYINWCETKINYLLSKDFIDSILGLILPG